MQRPSSIGIEQRHGTPSLPQVNRPLGLAEAAASQSALHTPTNALQLSTKKARIALDQEGGVPACLNRSGGEVERAESVFSRASISIMMAELTLRRLLIASSRATRCMLLNRRARESPRRLRIVLIKNGARLPCQALRHPRRKGTLIARRGGCQHPPCCCRRPWVLTPQHLQPVNEIILHNVSLDVMQTQATGLICTGSWHSGVAARSLREAGSRKVFINSRPAPGALENVAQSW